MNIGEIAEKLSSCIKVQSSYDKACFENILKLIQEQNKNYTCYDFICLGKFGPILKVTSTSSIKIVKVEKDNLEEIERLDQLYKFFSQFEKNNHIVGVFDGYYLTEKHGDEVIKLFYISETELCGGMLTGYLKQLKQSNSNLTEQQKERLAIQLLDAMNFFHKRGIQHRGIKQQSLFFKKEEDQSLTVKLSGYGCTESRKIATSGITYVTKLGEMKGTEYYIPLEVLNNQFCLQTDLFGLGILLIQIDNFEYDYSNISAEEFLEVQNEVHKNPFQNNKDIRKDSILYQIASGLLKKNPLERISAQEALKVLLNHSKQQNQNLDLVDYIKIDNN